MAHSEIATLREHRLDRDLTYRALGEAIGISRSQIHHILTAPRPHLNDRTLHKVRLYINRLRTDQQQPRRTA